MGILLFQLFHSFLGHLSIQSIRCECCIGKVVQVTLGSHSMYSVLPNTDRLVEGHNGKRQ